ncbi:MAG: Rieske 2Fe-2S domain-containing protein [Kofleriaceae bacterium]|nr:Rieske 2Fe-2S domain-containing protein [Myxococcales bacterium]MCB9573012.1 Rieske 2Fe-2S domain-containing protein [Kofleriaceae bacterium]
MSTRWLRVADVAAVPRDGVVPVDLDGRPAILYRAGDRWFCAQRRCPHADFDLAEGFVSRGYLVCPLHLWRFAVDTGIHELSPGVCLAMYAVRIEGQDVWVDPTPRRNCTPFDQYAQLEADLEDTRVGKAVPGSEPDPADPDLDPAPGPDPDPDRDPDPEGRNRP